MYDKEFWNPQGLRRTYLEEKVLEKNPKRPLHKRIQQWIMVMSNQIKDEIGLRQTIYVLFTNEITEVLGTSP